MSYDKLIERNRDLENEVYVLNKQKATIIACNKEFGTFEYLGKALPLSNTGKDLKTIKEILEALERWFKMPANKRLSIAGVFRSVDRS